MKKLITLLFVTLLSLVSTAQEYTSVSLVSKERVNLSTEEVTKEVNIFNISVKEGIVVHNKLGERGVYSSQIYKLVDYNISRDEEDISIEIGFESDENRYEFVLFATEYGFFLGTKGFLYRTEVYVLKQYN